LWVKKSILTPENLSGYRFTVCMASSPGTIDRYPLPAWMFPWSTMHHTKH
jgi:hypothetical protein